jgi:hypothetical protein
MPAFQRLSHDKRWKIILTVLILFLLVLKTNILCRFACVQSDEREEITPYKVMQAYMENGLVKYNAKSTSCRDHGQSLDLLIMIPSKITNFKQRTAIRKSWLSTAKTNHSIRHFFVLGKSDNVFYNAIASTESNIFNDIIRLDMTDNDENETLKSIRILEWVHMNCANVKYLLNIKDDIFLNVNSLLKYLKRSKPVNAVSGCRQDGTQISHLPSVKKHDSSLMTGVDFSHLMYIRGSAYLISGDIITKLYLATQRVPVFSSEDIYITGLCRQYIKADAIGHPGFSCGYREKGPCGSNFRYSITGNNYRPEEIVRMSKELNDRWSDCRLIDNYWISRAFDILRKILF